MIHNYEVESNLGKAQITYNDESQIVTCEVKGNSAYNFVASYDLIDKLHQQLEDIRLVAKMK